MRENRRKLERRLLQLGGRISTVRKSGAVRYSHPRVSRTIRCNNRRKDAPQAFVDFIRDVERLAQSTNTHPT